MAYDKQYPHIAIPINLHKAIKIIAAEEGKHIQAVSEEVVRLGLEAFEHKKEDSWKKN